MLRSQEPSYIIDGQNMSARLNIPLKLINELPSVTHFYYSWTLKLYSAGQILFHILRKITCSTEYPDIAINPSSVQNFLKKYQRAKNRRPSFLDTEDKENYNFLPFTPQKN